MSAPARALTVRHLQLLRALFAAVAALMITFSSDHSAAIGLSVFSGFALVTGFVLILGAWLAAPAGRRWPLVAMAIVGILAGMAAGIPAWRTDDAFFAILVSWAAATGLIELLAGIRARRWADPFARDAILIGSLSLLLAVALLLVPAGFAVDYTVNDSTFTLTGIILGVGILGGYAALVAVFLGIAGFTPARADVESAAEPATGGAA